MYPCTSLARTYMCVLVPLVPYRPCSKWRRWPLAATGDLDRLNARWTLSGNTSGHKCTCTTSNIVDACWVKPCQRVQHISQRCKHTLDVTYERGGVVGTETGVDGPGFPVLAQNLCVVRRVGFYEQTCQDRKKKNNIKMKFNFPQK